MRLGEGDVSPSTVDGRMIEKEEKAWKVTCKVKVKLSNGDIVNHQEITTSILH